MEPPLLEAVALTKRYGEVDALTGVDLIVPAGQVLAVLGPNGAGKTTLIRSIATLTRPTSGLLNVAGIDVVAEPSRVRRVIGLAGQYAAVEPAMTGRENLRMVARLSGHGRRDARSAADAVLEQLDLAEVGDRLVRNYSGGMRRRLDLGSSLVGAPKVLLLDEPTTGLDPRSRNELWSAIRELVGRGTDVILTTQYLEEADRLADRIAIIDGGRVVAQGSPAELKGLAGEDVVEVRVRDDADAHRAAGVLGSHAILEPNGTGISLPATDGVQDLIRVIGVLQDAGIALADIGVRRPTLDDVFLALTGRPAATDVGVEAAA
ncbi:ABC-2 type transport system ATP-binding protein [Nakamurella sp. UYEF19]|uniref:ATP-binding cassette domain-containing protein n=1 Tax=Nakamurella sp. UYEF19 TaxID=1756392 RepID=UPI00339A7262